MKRIISMIFVAIILTSAIGCSNWSKIQGQERNKTEVNEENNQQQEDTENSQEQKNKTDNNEEKTDFSKYKKYVDRTFYSGLLFHEFSKGNYPDEGIFILDIVDFDKLDSFSSDYDGENWYYYKAEDIEKDIISKLDISCEEIKNKAGYIEELNAYPALAGLGGAGIWAIIKDVKEKENTFEIYYECWGIKYNATTFEDEEKLDFTGKLIVSKEGKIISNSDIKYY